MLTPDTTAGRQIKLAFTRKEAAAALGVSAITIDRLTQRKLLSPCRATRRPLYAVSELERFLRDTRAAQFNQASPVADTSASDFAGDVSDQNQRKQ
jgi:hypothetical protein